MNEERADRADGWSPSVTVPAQRERPSSQFDAGDVATSASWNDLEPLPTGRGRAPRVVDLVDLVPPTEPHSSGDEPHSSGDDPHSSGDDPHSSGDDPHGEGASAAPTTSDRPDAPAHASIEPIAPSDAPAATGYAHTEQPTRPIATTSQPPATPIVGVQATPARATLIRRRLAEPHPEQPDGGGARRDVGHDEAEAPIESRRGSEHAEPLRTDPADADTHLDQQVSADSLESGRPTLRAEAGDDAALEFVWAPDAPGALIQLAKLAGLTIGSMAVVGLAAYFLGRTFGA